MNRIQLIQSLLDRQKGQPTKYLEIGIHEGQCFREISATEKYGVDPNPLYEAKNSVNGDEFIIKQPSDTFFSLNTALYDVVFVDGLHTYPQSLKDALNALKCLKTGGYLVLHDCLPTTEKEARESLEPEYGNWMGQVWKTALYLARKGFKIVVIDRDCGMGMVEKIDGQDLEVDKMLSELIEALDYDFFVNHFREEVEVV